MVGKQVRVVIKGGKVSADFGGFQGNDCKILEDRIRIDGLQVDEIVDKPELHNATVTDSNTDQMS